MKNDEFCAALLLEICHKLGINEDSINKAVKKYRKNKYDYFRMKRLQKIEEAKDPW